MNKLSTEQQAVVACNANTLKVQASAGTGKTHTLREYAKARPKERILYLAFNKKVAKEAGASFPKNVDCLTTHALAFATHGAQFRDASKAGDMKPSELARYYNIQSKQADVIQKTMWRYLHSDTKALELRHVPDYITGTDRLSALEWAQRLWEDTCDLNCTAVRASPDVFLKLYELSQPRLDRKYDVILFDEAQDANPATLSILMRQTCRKIIVGDRYQSIYAFRGAVNAMQTIHADVTLPLTHSFRFGPKLSALASELLQRCCSETRPIVSALGLSTELSIDESKPYASISRSNVRALGTAIQLLDMKSFHFVGGPDGYRLGIAMDAYHLWSGTRANIVALAMKAFDSFEDFVKASEETDDFEATSAIRLVGTYQNELPALIDRVRAAHVNDAAEAHVMLSTAHRAKGMEFAQVQLASDFPELLSEDDKPRIEPQSRFLQEVNLQYVAMTRAVSAIALGPQLERLFGIDSSNRAVRSAVAPESRPIAKVIAKAQTPREPADQTTSPKRIDAATVPLLRTSTPALKVFPASLGASPAFSAPRWTNLERRVAEMLASYGPTTSRHIANSLDVPPDEMLRVAARMVSEGKLFRGFFYHTDGAVLELAKRL